MDRQLTVHQGDVQASAHVVFHRTHDPEEKEEKQNTTVGPECGVDTLELCEGPHGVMPKHRETHGIIGAICYLLETSGGLDSLRSLSWHVWTRTVCPGKREGPCLGLGGAGGRVSPCPQARRKAEPGKLVLSCHVWDPQVEPSCVPAAQHPYPILLYPWEKCTSPSQARRVTALTSHSDWASVVM